MHIDVFLQELVQLYVISDFKLAARAANVSTRIWKVESLSAPTVIDFTLVFWIDDHSRTSDIESNNSQIGGLEDYNNISDGIFPHFPTPSIKISLG